MKADDSNTNVIKLKANKKRSIDNDYKVQVIMQYTYASRCKMTQTTYQLITHERFYIWLLLLLEAKLSHIKIQQEIKETDTKQNLINEKGF